MKIALFTYAPDGAGLLELEALWWSALPNRYEYCEKWGYTHIHSRERNTNWYYAVERLIHVIELLDSYDFVWILNVSSVITNLRIPLDAYLYGDNLVYAYFAEPDRNGLNAGSVVFTAAAKNWLNEVITDAVAANHPWHEQHIFQKRYNPERYALLRNPSINQYHHRLIGWPEREPQDWRKGDFVLSLPGTRLDRRAEYMTKALRKVIR